jgi:hypothetical protein
MYDAGLQFVGDKSLQRIVDIGSIGLAYAVRIQSSKKNL